MLTSVGPGREEESHNLRIQDSLHKNEGLATFTPRCHKGLQKQPVPATCQTTSHLNTFATVILLTGKLFPGMNLTTRDKASLTTLFKAPLSRPLSCLKPLSPDPVWTNPALPHFRSPLFSFLSISLLCFIFPRVLVTTWLDIIHLLTIYLPHLNIKFMRSSLFLYYPKHCLA